MLSLVISLKNQADADEAVAPPKTKKAASSMEAALHY